MRAFPGVDGADYPESGFDALQALWVAGIRAMLRQAGIETLTHSLEGTFT